MNQQDPFDELMRRALADEAAKVEPKDRLPEIRARIRAQRRPSAGRRPWMLAVGGALVGTAAALGLFAVLTGDPQTSDDSPQVASPVTSRTTASSRPTASSLHPAPTPTSSLPSSGGPGSSQPTSKRPTTGPATRPTQSEATKPSTIPAPGAGTPEAETSKAVPLYWAGKVVGARVESQVRLYRTYARINGRPAYEAVRRMVAGKVADPDYTSYWQGARVASVLRSDGVVTVDFDALPEATLDGPTARVAVQQLVYTVQGAMGTGNAEPVRITEQGRAVPALFGAIDTRRPISRAQALDVQALVWVVTPENGATLTSPVKVTGIAAVYEATLNWQVTAAGTAEVVMRGTANTAEGGTFSPYAFSVRLPPGKYVLEVFESSAEDGRATSTDSKTITVR
jgi:Immunoglobulin-like domain of bacterial spore germination/Sporulation and spore germination